MKSRAKTEPTNDTTTIMFPDFAIGIPETMALARDRKINLPKWIEHNVRGAWDLGKISRKTFLEIHKRVHEDSKNQPSSFILVYLTKEKPGTF